MNAATRILVGLATVLAIVASGCGVDWKAYSSTVDAGPGATRFVIPTWATDIEVDADVDRIEFRSGETDRAGEEFPPGPPLLGGGWLVVEISTGSGATWRPADATDVLVVTLEFR